MLTQNNVLTTLRLSDNNIGEVGTKAIAEALKTNRTLTALYLYNNDIGDTGTQHLMEALMITGTLTTLYLHNNNIQLDGARSVGAMLEKNVTLRTLWLGGNDWDVEGDGTIVSALEARNFTLCYLSGVENVDHLLERNELIVSSRKARVSAWSTFECCPTTSAVPASCSAADWVETIRPRWLHEGIVVISCW
jgi:hypothetical protein